MAESFNLTFEKIRPGRWLRLAAQDRRFTTAPTGLFATSQYTGW